MKIAYLDCFSGVSGDMCLGALVDAGVPLQYLRDVLAGLPVSGYSLTEERVRRGGVVATRVRVQLDGGHDQPHRGLTDVLEIIAGGSLDEEVAEGSSAVFRRLAEAEGKVHGVGPEEVHFHEVGAVDAVCDIVGAVAGLRRLGVEAVKFSTVRLGGGTVRAAHGTLPVPAPATVELLRGLPTAGGPIDLELTTPTGAALLSTLGEPSPQWPPMMVETIGYGAGERDPAELPNVLRLAVGTESGAEAPADRVWVLETNLDDMTGEEVGYCTEVLLARGALDVFVTPVQMKKNRPGVQITVLCPPERLREMEKLLWRHTTTLGIRRLLWQRSRLARRTRTVTTPWGEVRVKVALLGEEVVRREPEYEDCREVAAQNDLAFREVFRAALRALEDQE
ncbi:MAG: nickel pincer cofactor biosynthesis protein LarC [Candidatus Brocadiaceae bacterium]|jgi:hypothetical protein